MRLKFHPLSCFLSAAVLWIFFFFSILSCSSSRNAVFLQAVTEAPKTEEAYRITDFEGNAEGDGLPLWVSEYLERGIRGVEALDTYRNRYVFIGSGEGDNFNALRHWSRGFTVYQDFALLAAQRIEERFYHGTEYYPDDEYGQFFAASMRRAYDLEYYGAVKEAVFWIKKQIFEDENQEGGAERYEFLVLVSIEKPDLEAQVRDILSINPTPKPIKRQASAIQRLRENFFENF
ncbi:MAG: hypothetical protein LBE10_01645 [Treponema sp.]|jgi:hypothetical protein|nr:hypothetical protein [Treponema sp.]